jgi:hypothetical protein
MKRTALYVWVFAAILALGAAGCGGKKKTRTARSKRTRGRDGGPRVVGGIDFDRYWPRDEVQQLTPAQRAKLLELALAGLRGNNWEHARDVLVAIGKDSVPHLIKQVESAEETSACADPIPVVVQARVKTLGELSHDVLLQIVQYHSNYKGQMPVRKVAAWQKWWKQTEVGLKIK